MRLIEIKHLGKVFSTNSGNLEVLRDINLQIARGEIFGIIGLSGAGKSTLVRCMNYLEKPTEGEVFFDGREMGSLKDHELLKARQSMSMVFQGFNLLSQRNVLKNVCFPLEIAGVARAEARKKAAEMLELVGLSNKSDAFPSQLSGGQKQRVAIARALSTDPKVLLCDEVTSALDPNTTRSILELLRSINQKLGVTIVIITHEMQVIEQICHRVAVIDQSRIVEVGDVREIFLRPRSDIAKQLILPKGNAISAITGNRCLRLIFDGSSALEPIISNIALECKTAVNILFANTKTVDGMAYGEMLIQLPADENSVARVLNFLGDKEIHFKEEELNV
ncbi:MAG: ATP-binding cassette domain-containing protein [Thermoclostridium sp.]|nr:ATP-binding cassette domain-containing protein [Thermoclostridium sp.]